MCWFCNPHDEYYGRHGKGLKDYPAAKKNLLYYSTNAVPGTNTLVINLRSILPSHFQGIVSSPTLNMMLYLCTSLGLGTDG